MKIWAKRGVFFSLLIVIGAIYMAAGPKQQTTPTSQPKGILGEQNPPSSIPAELETYVVKKGDTLFNVSQNYGLSWQTLAEINNLEEPFLLKIGQKLQIPLKGSN